MPLPKVGDLAPDFEAVSDSGEPIRLSDFRGQTIVLYFYPKADTLSCTAQACAFNDDYALYRSRNVSVIGVSPDAVDKQAGFKSKYDLQFPLIADAERQIVELYGVWQTFEVITEKGDKVMYTGVKRSCLIIDPEGRITHVFEGVDAKTNSLIVLGALDEPTVS